MPYLITMLDKMLSSKLFTISPDSKFIGLSEENPGKKQSQVKQVAQRTTIAHLSSMCQVNLPQNLMQPFPQPNDATHKI